jgi:hypothetical protein
MENYWKPCYRTGGGGGGAGGSSNVTQNSRSAALSHAQSIINNPLQDDIAFEQYQTLKRIRLSRKEWVKGFKETRDQVLNLKQKYANEYSKGMTLADRATQKLKQGKTTEWRKLSNQSDKAIQSSNKTLGQLKESMGFLALAAERTGNVLK